MQGFSGFPDGKQTGILLPGLFFSQLLPAIDHMAEMKVTLYCLWAVQVQDGPYRYVRLSEVLHDKLFMKGFIGDAEAAVREGFARAVARGTLLHVTAVLPLGEDDYYFLNSEHGRKALAAIEQEGWLPDSDLRPIALTIERPTIFTLYEQNIGPLTPMIADQLRDISEDYPTAWIKEAIQIAVNKQARHLNYIVAVLERRRTGNRPQQQSAAMPDEQSRGEKQP